MAPHSSTLAWKIPWTEEPGRLQSLGSLRVGFDWTASLSLFTFMHWRRKWQATPVFLPGESQRQGSLVGCHLWGHAELDTTEVTSHFSRVWLFAILRTIAHQAPLSMGFSRQEYWSGQPIPSPVDFPDPGIEPESPALQADSFPTELSGKPKKCMYLNFKILYC